MAINSSNTRQLVGLLTKKHNKMLKRILFIILFIPILIFQTCIQLPFGLIKWIIKGGELVDNLGEPAVSQYLDWAKNKTKIYEN